MDIEDIDSWYEEKKQMLMEEYLSQIEKGKNKKKAEEKYEKKMQDAIKKYYAAMNEKLDSAKKTRLERMISDIKARITIRK